MIIGVFNNFNASTGLVEKSSLHGITEASDVEYNAIKEDCNQDL